MFSLMGNCVSCIKKRREPKRPITLAFLGLDCAGKSTTTKVLIGEPFDKDIAPTVGFNSEKFVFNKFDITMYDLGGGPQIRAMWTTYLPELYGVVYMIDSTASERLEEVKESFQKLIANYHIAGKPVLVLANKQDKEDAVDEVDICEQLDLSNWVNLHKTPCRIESCSAVKGTGRKMDPAIKEGMQWLCDMIEKNFDPLKTRVDKDMAEEKEKEKIELAARRERVRKIKEERERKEEEERKRLGIEEKQEESEGEDFIDGDPFKYVDVEKLKEKEAQMKEEKRRLKELKAKAKGEDDRTMTKTDDLEEADYLRTPHSNRPYGLAPLGDKCAEDSDELVSPSTNRSRRVLPPLQQPLGTKFMEDGTAKKKKKKKVKQKNAYSENAEYGSEYSQTGDDTARLAESQKTMRSVSKISVTAKSFGDENGDDIRTSSHKLTPLDGEDGAHTPKETKLKKKKRFEDSQQSNGGFELHDAAELSPIPRPLPSRLVATVDSGMDNGSDSEIKKMKKKKKPKKNQLSPSQNDLELSPSTRADYSSRNYPWDKPNSYLDGSDQEDKHRNSQTTDFGEKWGLVDELPEVSDSALRMRPNYDDDDDIML
ncbi:ADP-ribosylation factor-like protein 13B [Haliotis cracherodii]|uniref:ADP-ribosylation factor-like protein 13B n=1 Tax=Haliotis cracherodii TaxID=6455 RepID=UPI0039E7DE0A